MNKKFVTIFGTRPEAIKLYKITKLLDNNTIVSTGQHRELLDKIINSLNINIDYDLKVMKENQDLNNLTSNIIIKTSNILQQLNPDIVIVHGDTTTALASSIAAFHLKMKIAHVEAGLRSNNKSSPFPEENNRSLISRMATYHFCPTYNNIVNLNKENIYDNVYLTGNTGIDTLLNFSKSNDIPNSLSNIEKYIKSKYILVTCHRRENFGSGFENICNALIELSKKFNDINIIFPVHLNPNIKDIANKKLSNYENILIIEPQEYIEFVYLMKNCFFILTDSGGIQEEAPSLNKPVLVMRDETERNEVIEAGCVKLVGSNIENIISYSTNLIQNINYYNSMININNPYGDGFASEKIIKVLNNL